MKQVFLSVILTVMMLLAAPVSAQTPAGIDFQKWEQQAAEAENLLESERVPKGQLDDLRRQMIDWRKQFVEGQNVNAGRIDTVKEQIAALGPAPAEGSSEDEEIAARRTKLNEQLATLQAPRLSAVEAFSRADSIIKEIDSQITEQEAVELAELSPSPLKPESWTEAVTETVRLVSGMTSDTASLNAHGGGWSEMRGRLPKALAYLALALGLLTFGRRWIEALPSKLSARASEHSRAVVAFLVSLGQIAVPMLGIFLAIRGLDATGWFGHWSRPFLLALPGAGVILFGGRWLARQMFPRASVAYDTLIMPAKRRAIARNSTHLLAAVFAVHHILSDALLPQSGLFETPGSQDSRVPMTFGDGATAVWHFVMIVIAAVVLFRLGNVLRKLPSFSKAEDVRMRDRVLGLAGILSRLIAVVSVGLAAYGLINMANALIWPWLLTLALICVLILMQDFIADLFDMLSNGQEGAREGLAPLTIGGLLVLLSVPVFAVIWGASSNDLLEFWIRVQQGVTFGGITVSPTGVLTFIVVFAIGYTITRTVQGALRSSVLPKTKLDPGGQNALVSGLGYVGIFLAAVIAITSAGIDLSSLAIVAGALSVGIGFGLQNIVSNFVAGIILLIERPISVGDWVDAGGQQGIVKRISVRSTSVETFDKTEVIVPNSDLVSQPVTNWTRSNRNGRVIIPVGVAYGTDTRKVEAILREIIEDQPTVMIDPAPSVLFRGLGADSLNFEMRAILSDASGGLGVTSDVLHEVVRRFGEEGIEIPFAQRDIWLRNPEMLPGAKPATGKDEASPAAEPARAPEPVAPNRPDARLVFDAEHGGDDDDGDGDGGDGDGDGQS